MIKKIKRQIKHFLEDQKEYGPLLTEVAERYHIPVWSVRLDSLWCRLRYGAPVSEYISFEFYRLNAKERCQFMTYAKTQKLKYILNNTTKEEAKTLDEKQTFNKLYAKYIYRDWAYTPECSAEEIRNLLEKNAYVIVKPSDKLKGEGVHKEKSSDLLENFDAFLAEAKASKTLIEGVIIQHPAMSSVNPTSVNTIRVASIREKSGKVHIIGTSLRGGGVGAVIDNLHAGGVQYPVDVETGIITRGGVQFDGKKNIYFHPGSNTKMIGFQVPNWDKVISTVIEAAQIPQNIRYIGWDVAVTEEGCELVEANFSQGCNGMQLDGVGKFAMIKSML